METKLEVKFSHPTEHTVWTKRIEFKRGKLTGRIGIAPEGPAIDRQRLFAPNHTPRHLAR